MDPIIIKQTGEYIINPNVWNNTKRYSSFQEANDDLIRYLSKQGFNYRQHKVAYHGGIGGGTPTGWAGNWSPFSGNSPMYNPLTVAPEFGGNTRTNTYNRFGHPPFPSAGDHQIDDDRDHKDKSTKQMGPEDYHEIYLKNLIDKQIKGTDIDKDGKSYIVMIQFDDHKKAEEFAEKHPGKAKVTKYNGVEIYCPSFESALEFEKLVPGVVIKTV